MGGGIIRKILYFTSTTKENWKENCNSNNALKFPSRNIGRENQLHIEYIGAVKFKLANLQSHPSKKIQHQFTSFHSLA